MNVEELEQLLVAAGGTDLGYLHHHYPRYAHTRREVEATAALPAGACILDIGAHWLHQAALWVGEDREVLALDLPQTLELPEVQAAAHELGIHLLPNADLEAAPALAGLADASLDLILFTEIIEHITFNPVHLWSEVHRILKPGGRIVVTTPNYYAARGRLWTPRRFLARLGGGIEVNDILTMHTYAHHWKEYSLRELVKYFTLLSTDFNCIKALHVPDYYPGYSGRPLRRLAGVLERRVELLRPNLHLEVRLEGKEGGIRVEPHW